MRSNFTLVDTLIRLRHVDNVHVPCGLRPVEEAISVECRPLCAISPSFTLQSDIPSRCHRVGRDAQEHLGICTRYHSYIHIYNSQLETGLLCSTDTRTTSGLPLTVNADIEEVAARLCGRLAPVKPSVLLFACGDAATGVGHGAPLDSTRLQRQLVGGADAYSPHHPPAE